MREHQGHLPTLLLSPNATLSGLPHSHWILYMEPTFQLIEQMSWDAQGMVRKQIGAAVSNRKNKCEKLGLHNNHTH